MSVRDDAIEAGSWAETLAAGRVGAEVAEVVVDAAIPVLLAPLREMVADFKRCRGSFEAFAEVLEEKIDGIERGAL